MFHVVTCAKEIGRWTIRVNGRFVADFWREALARRIAMRLANALEAGRQDGNT